MASGYSYGGRGNYSYAPKLKVVERAPDGTPKNTAQVLFKVLVPRAAVHSSSWLGRSSYLQTT